MKENHKSLSVNMVIINAKEEIHQAIVNKNWVLGFVIAVTFFERYGLKIIKKICKTRKISEGKVKNWGIMNIIVVLRLLNKISKNDYDSMIEIKDMWKDLVHPDEEKVGDKYLKEKEPHRKRLLEKAINCIKHLKET